MKIKKTVLMTIGLSIALSSFGDVELVWQKDLAPDLGAFTTYRDSAGLFESSKIRQFPNDDVALIFSDDATSNAVIVLNMDGDVLIKDQFQPDFEPRFVGRACREQFMLDMYVSGQKTLRVYEYDGINTSITNIPYSTGFSLSQFEGAISQNFYTLDGTILSKFKITSNPVNILGDVYAGIDGSNFKLTWKSISGQEYQIQSTVDLTNWVVVGTTIIGTGDLLTWANALTNSSSFFRVIEN